jgi:hypothetical protein
VDASPSNTTGSEFTMDGRVYDDNKWSFRTVGSSNFDAVENTVMEAGPKGGSENVPSLTTKISGLKPRARYHIYVYFISYPSSDPGQNWKIRAGLQPGSLSIFDRDSPNVTSMDSGSTTTLTDPQGKPVAVPTERIFLQASIGTAVADASGNILVHIDAGDFADNDANSRAWFDGVGYKRAGKKSSHE